MVTTSKMLLRLPGVAVAGLLVVAGCSGPKPVQAPAEASTPKVWPAPPEQARIEYVQSFHRPSDIGLRASAVVRFGRWLTGSEKGNEPLIKPFGIALDENDNLCLTDTGANAVCYYDRTRKKWRRWDKLGKLHLVAPVGIARRNGIFFVADSGLGRVLAFDDSGKVSLQLTNHLERPTGLVILNEQLYVADAQRHCVVVFDLHGNYRFQFGRRGLGPGQFNFPTHLAADAAGDLFVTDSMNSRVQVFDASGQFKSQIGSIGDSPGHFARPKGLAMDSLNHLYVVDASFDNFQIFDREGHLLLHVGETGAEPGQFWLPNGVAISRQNEIFVTDSYNHRVQIFKYVGPS